MSDRRADKDWCAPRGLDLHKRSWLFKWHGMIYRQS